MKIESNPYLSLNWFWELKLNLVRVSLYFQQTCFRGGDLGLLWVTMFTPMCKLWPVDQTGSVLGWKLPVMSSFMWKWSFLLLQSFLAHLVSQGLQAKRLKKLLCGHLKEIAALFAKDVALSRQIVGLKKTRLGLWAVAPKKVERELSEKEF